MTRTPWRMKGVLLISISFNTRNMDVTLIHLHLNPAKEVYDSKQVFPM